MSDDGLRFEPLSERTLPLLATWRSQPHVARWFHGALTPEQTAAKFLPRIRGDDPVQGYIAYLGDEPVGYIQSYRVGDHPHTAAAMGVDGDARGIDLLIGDAGSIGRGLGVRVVREFCEQLWRDARIERIVTNPDVDNAAAIRCYEKAGFTRLRTIPGTQDANQHLLLERRRNAQHVSVPLT